MSNQIVTSSKGVFSVTALRGGSTQTGYRFQASGVKG